MKLKEKEELYLRYKFEYYILCKPTVSDSVFDKLEKELRDNNSNIVDLVDFPNVKEIEKLGFDLEKICPEQKVKRNETKYKHSTPMLSIQKLQVNDETNIPYHELNLFLKKEKSEYYICEPKYDGNSMSLNYINGKLVSALSRGDGTEGLQRLNKIRLIVPNKINIQGNIEIRGEVVINRKTFKDKYFVDGEVSNERNWVAGAISKENVNIDEINDLVFVAYSLVSVDNNEIIYIENSNEILEENGFNKNHKPFLRKIKNSSEFEKMYFEFKEYRKNCEFLLDGIVIKFPENMRLKMKSKIKYPAWCLAIKFESVEVSTIIEKIIWDIGKNNEFTPIAILKEVELGGTLNKRASLHNLSFIIKHGAFPKSTVNIRKAGEIINQVVSVVEKSPDHDEYMKEYENFIKSN